jgi:hypothetical protein
MALLSDPQRAAVYARLAQDVSAVREPCGLTKAQLRAALDAADAWADANAAAYNAALPAAARAGLTPAQKARILTYVITKRWEVS